MERSRYQLRCEGWVHDKFVERRLGEIVFDEPIFMGMRHGKHTSKSETLLIPPLASAWLPALTLRTSEQPAFKFTFCLWIDNAVACSIQRLRCV